MQTKHINMLVILDGFGSRTNTHFNAIAHANTPYLKQWFSWYPHTTLQATGTAVGLPKGYIGNSEVGHLTIGAGRVIEQPLTIINNAIETNTFFTNPILTKQLDSIAHTKKTLHIIGLLSDAGVHSHEEHSYAFIKSALDHDVKKIIIHPFLDGRDVLPQSAAIYLQRLENKIQLHPEVRIGSIHGRFYAMDRDSNWDRTLISYNALTSLHDERYATWQSVLDHFYKQNITDEFIPPTQLTTMQAIQDDDGIIFFNFRPDRARQLTACFTSADLKNIITKIPFALSRLRQGFVAQGSSLKSGLLLSSCLQRIEESKGKRNLSFFITPISYGAQYQTTILYPSKPVKNTLKEILAHHNKTIFTIAETEKYAQVTYFFNGEKEEIQKSEAQILIPSIKDKNYIYHPCMSAPEITNQVLASLQDNPCDFYLINYANADMVAHSGSFEATVKAIECLDHELERLFTQVITKMNGTIYITSDHGHAEYMYDEEHHQPHTAHTTFPVPFIIIQNDLKNQKIELSLKQLSDIAPFILEQMGLPVPEEMKEINYKKL